MSDIKRDCVHYDFGETCPSAYGAFCKPHGNIKVRVMTNTLCKDCNDYETKTIILNGNE